MTDKYELKNKKGHVFGTIEKRSTDNTPYVGEFDSVTTPIYKLAAYLGLAIGGAVGAQHGYAANAGVGYFIIYVVGYAAGGAFVGALLAIPLVILASAVTYAQPQGICNPLGDCWCNCFHLAFSQHPISLSITDCAELNGDRPSQVTRL